jgi:DNA-3-methyladenine glycosylase
MNIRPRCPTVKAEGRICPVSADQLAVDPVAAAHRLLGATLSGRGVSATIVEVEAYGGVPDGPWPDAAAHSYRGPNGRNAVMFGPPGRLYTYRSHGIHVCANVACGPEGTAAAVLLRGAAIESGLDVARSRRGESIRTAALARGPGNLCRLWRLWLQGRAEVSAYRRSPRAPAPGASD